MRLFDVQHQWAAQRRLQVMLAAGRLPHAFLFSGPPGVGKRMLAQRMARLLLCSSPVEVEPPAESAAHGGPSPWRDGCGRCEECVLMEAGMHPDYHAVHRTLNRFHPDGEIRKRKAIELSVEVVRHFVIDQVGQRPARGRAKVFLIEDAERMNDSSQNAMLKTLEEPPDASYVILLTPGIELMFPTTRSRCQAVNFEPLPMDYVMELVAARAIPAAEARYVAGMSEGSAGLALDYTARGLGHRRGAVADALASVDRDPVAFGKRMKELADEVGKRPGEPNEEESADTDSLRTAQHIVLRMLSCLLRDVLRVASGCEPLAHEEAADLKIIAEMADRFGRAGAARAVRAAAAAGAELDQNVNVGLVFDVLGIETARCLGSAVYTS